MDLVGADIQWDLRYGMPFKDNNIEQIYSSHLFEHLTSGETKELLEECKRVLKPGGIFSICVPNAKRYIDAYCNKDTSFWEQQQEDFYPPAFNNTTIID
jgi:predicted SAM-dependent methyltransferase